MNKKELVNAMAEVTGAKKGDTKKALEAFVEVVEDSLAKGEKVQITGFGTFDVVKRKARNGVNPATGEKIHIPASKAPKFKASKNLKASI